MTRNLAVEYQLAPEEILEVIAESSRCEQMVKGFVAERHFENLLKALKARGAIDHWERINQDGKPDFLITINGREVLVEVKMFMTKVPKDGRFLVDFQRTRNSKDDKRSRYYRRSEFEVLAACTFNRNKRWDFVFVRTADLPLDAEMGEDCLDKHVSYDPNDKRWTSDIMVALGIKEEKGESKISPVSLDSFA